MNEFDEKLVKLVYAKSLNIIRQANGKFNDCLNDLEKLIKESVDNEDRANNAE